MARILLIEDDPILCTLFPVTLERAGHVVTTTQNPLEGLEIALREHFDVILTDDVKPKMGGFELVRRLRQDNELPPSQWA